jgi:hypothetical protein
MSNLPIKVDLEPAVRGDKWQGVASIGPVLINDEQPTFPLARIRVQFRRAGKLGMTLDSAPADGEFPITISNAETWFAYVPEIQPLPLDAGDWEWDMEFWADGDDAPLTFYYGVLKVTTDQTRPRP